ncbi:uncharacterized protein [Anabrus simplex]|uniref:uncharacterized protein n=1 Tax=Anabrus simplex TaxID=316456 RepID=UPI0035A35594
MNANGSIITLEISSPAVPGAFLALIFTLGLCLNVVLVYTIASSLTLRRVTFNLLLLQLSVTCALECLLNITASIMFLTSLARTTPKQVNLTISLCRANSAIAQFTITMQSLVLAAIAADRALTLCCTSSKDEAGNSSKGRLEAAVRRVFPGVAWLYALLLVLPIVVSTNLVQIRPFSNRYLCGVVRAAYDTAVPEDLIYPSLLLILGDLVPWLVITSAVTAIGRHVNAERRRQRQLEEAALHRSGQGATLGSSPIWTTSRDTSWTTWFGCNSCWDDTSFYLIMIILIIIYIILLVPHILSVHIYPFTIVLPSPNRNSTSMSSSSTSEIAWQLMPVMTGEYDDFFIWCRYKFTIIAPIVVLIVHKEVRKKCGHLFCCCCCRNNSVMHLDDARSVSASVAKKALQNNAGAKKKFRKKKTKEKNNKYRRIASYRTPVLFATSEGLHLRLVDNRMEESGLVSEKDDGPQEPLWLGEPRFICEFCDLAIITSTPIESVVNPGNNVHSYAVGRSHKQPARFVEDAVAEKDLHLSDHHGDPGQFYTSFRKDEEIIPRKTNSNKKIVRFAQKVDEIPLAESGVWSAPEDALQPESLNYSFKSIPPVPPHLSFSRNKRSNSIDPVIVPRGTYRPPVVQRRSHSTEPVPVRRVLPRIKR